MLTSSKCSLSQSQSNCLPQFQSIKKKAQTKCIIPKESKDLFIISGRDIPMTSTGKIGPPKSQKLRQKRQSFDMKTISPNACFVRMNVDENGVLLI